MGCERVQAGVYFACQECFNVLVEQFARIATPVLESEEWLMGVWAITNELVFLIGFDCAQPVECSSILENVHFYPLGSLVLFRIFDVVREGFC